MTKAKIDRLLEQNGLADYHIPFMACSLGIEKVPVVEGIGAIAQWLKQAGGESGYAMESKLWKKRGRLRHKLWNQLFLADSCFGAAEAETVEEFPDVGTGSRLGLQGDMRAVKSVGGGDADPQRVWWF